MKAKKIKIEAKVIKLDKLQRKLLAKLENLGYEVIIVIQK